MKEIQCKNCSNKVDIGSPERPVWKCSHYNCIFLMSTLHDCDYYVPVDTFEPAQCTGVRDYHIGESDYSKHKIQPWDIWLEYNLNPWDADIVKRVLRNKTTDTRRMDYEKIIHVCKERIRQIDEESEKTC